MFSFITKYFQAFGTPVSTVILMELLSEFARYGSKYDLTETERKLFEFLLTEASRMVKNFNNFFKDKYGFSLIKNMNDEKRSVMFWFVALFYYVNISESFQYKKYGYSADAIKKLAENFFSIVEAVHGEVDALDIFAHLDTDVGRPEHMIEAQMWLELNIPSLWCDYMNTSMQMLPNDPVDMMLRIESAAEFHGLLEFLNDWLENKKLLYPS
ncbi:hypothetical protein A3C89_03910 [Candidatus Kaiserbacteria bacterium RIFCSPHIGHO2_02_FULL_50_50]|uniref:Uncharacterized protein n=1 Tax=Candidatus Kaiserbacteria bacterium RIFCSPHIGHO2_02_FULL_50_50 TaxID=1798492 RepID=A0A1F6DF49_9BACT|nr:MAG: hypothetical protein A3C89_03910 [Candidatus Kaiserbacteria bacterium RIFCSPHIGHO2_02_FULL_50_50]OGG88239.1 MAG: hypothetical protein A3G62_04045 [Candidatus Kaiserbacteria bacterium RIFCSPLOWO2_12_FULL_50_10]